MHSQYRTPKRRHSSLFQRMQQEIQKISRKLSVAKTSARQSSYQKIRSLKKDTQKQFREKVKQNLFEPSINKNSLQKTNHKNIRKNIHFDQRVQPSIIQTVRIKHASDQNIQYSPFSAKKTVNSKTLNRRINFASFRENQQQRILKLQQENQQLSVQIKNLQKVCEDQSCRLGYASAYFDDKCKKIERQNQQYRKQNIYLKKLCDHYKSKSKKYKQILNKHSNGNDSQYFQDQRG